MANYEELEGTEVEVTFKPNNVEMCTVGVIEEGVGITLHDSEGKDAVCLNGPLSPHWEKFCNKFPLHGEKYEEMFDKCIEQIKTGSLNVHECTYGIMNTTPPKFGNVQCAFK